MGNNYHVFDAPSAEDLWIFISLRHYNRKVDNVPFSGDQYPIKAKPT